jgi:hypothetical protein
MKQTACADALKTLIGGCAALLLGACGGDDEGPKPVPTKLVAGFENPDSTFYFYDSGTDQDLVGAAAVTASVDPYGGAYIQIQGQDPINLAGAYADTKILTWELVAGPSSSTALRFAHAPNPYPVGWGGGMYFTLGTGSSDCFDASGYAGVSMWLKGHGFGYLQLSGTGAAPSGPEETAGTQSQREITIPGEWTQVDVTWSSLKKQTEGAALDPKCLGMIHFWMDRYSQAARDKVGTDRAFEIVIDDIWLLK